MSKAWASLRCTEAEQRGKLNNHTEVGTWLLWFPCSLLFFFIYLILSPCSLLLAAIIQVIFPIKVFSIVNSLTLPLQSKGATVHCCILKGHQSALLKISRTTEGDKNRRFLAWQALVYKVIHPESSEVTAHPACLICVGQKGVCSSKISLKHWGLLVELKAEVLMTSSGLGHHPVLCKYLKNYQNIL